MGRGGRCHPTPAEMGDASSSAPMDCLVDLRPTVAGEDGPPRSQTRYATAGDWEVHRATITRLYLTENRILRDVKREMEQEHGFFATYVLRCHSDCQSS